MATAFSSYSPRDHPDHRSVHRHGPDAIALSTAPSAYSPAVDINDSESPLDTLVRRTSSRRNAAGRDRRQMIEQQRRGQQQQQSELLYSHSPTSEVGSSDGEAQYASYSGSGRSRSPQDASRSAPPRQHDVQLTVHPPQDLPSPLLHSQFARESVGTYDTSMNSRSPDSRTSFASTSFNPHSPGTRASQYTQESHYDDEDILSAYRYPYNRDEATSVYSHATAHHLDPALRDSWRSANIATQGNQPSLLSSRHPPRPKPNDQMPPSPVSPVPTVIVSSPSHPDAQRTPTQPGRAAIIKPITANFSRPVRAQPAMATPEGERVNPQLPPIMQEQKKAVLDRQATRKKMEGQNPTSAPPQSGGLRPDAANPPPASPVSLYSNYSYYGSPLPSPTDSTRMEPPTGEIRKSKSAPTMKQGQELSPSSAGIRTPEDWLQLGITHHEANRLQESVRCFERSANENGGCGVGMLMYGLALRHGWGCVKNEALGFKWLRKAAESAVGDLEKLRTGGSNEIGAVQSEMVLAIYEVGQCFFHGWGAAKDQKMGVSYYAVAAQLGDADAQYDLGFCLANGKGCKKDKKGAAKWYREAVKQGLSDVGLTWIYKEKYQ